MYEYASLPSRHVRLLTILPGQPQDVLAGSLNITSLDEGPEFEAFSYLWGPPVFTAKLALLGKDGEADNTGGSDVTHDLTNLSLDGAREGSGHVMITESLAKGIAEFRLTDKVRIVWIDQICINQADLKERAAQVQLMGDLYKRAAKVLLWLGADPGNDAPAASHLIRDIAIARKRWEFGGEADQEAVTEKKFRSLRGVLDFLPPEEGERHLQTVFTMPEKDTPEMNALTRLVELPYWGRAWILQEVRLAAGTEAKWGTTHIDIDALADVVEWVLHSEGTTLESSLRISYLSNVFHCVCGRPGIIETLSKAFSFMSSRTATNPVDRIYAFLGLIASKPTICVSYEKPIVDVYTDAFLEAIEETGNLDVLSRTYPTKELITEHRAAGWPTWLPDLETRPVSVALLDYLRFASACGKEDHSSRFATASILKPLPNKENGYKLQLRGIVADRVAQTSTFAFSPATYQPWSEFYDYMSAAYDVVHDTHSAELFVRAVICASGSYWEETGDLTELNQSGRANISDYIAYRQIGSETLSRKTFIAVMEAKMHTHLMFACAFAGGLKKRLPQPSQPTAVIVREIALVDGLLNELYEFEYHVEASDLYYWGGDDEDVDANILKVRDRRREAMNAFSQEEPEEYHGLKEEFEKCLQAYYADEGALAHAVSVFLLLQYEAVRVLSDSDAATFVSRYGRLIAGRTFFRSESGRAGLGTHGTESGDVIAILAGGKIPVVMRPVAGGGHVFIGEGYLEGCMHGELLEDKFYTDSADEAEGPADDNVVSLETFTLLGSW